MSEFDNNGFETAETVETVETVENVETVDPNGNASGSYDAGGYTETTYDTTYDPNYAAGNEGGSKVFGIISLVCGILAVLCSCCGWFGIVLAVAAIVLGILSINKGEDAKGMAIAGIVCGGVGLLIGIIVIIMGAALQSVDQDSVEQFVEQFENSL